MSARAEAPLILLAALAPACAGSVERAPGAPPERAASAGESDRAARAVWTSWRGPEGHGVSRETGLVDEVAIGGEGHLWTVPLSGRGTPVVSGDRVYAMAYDGEGAELQERLVCLDLETGEMVWEHRWNDFLSDVVYDRYAIGSPAVDPASGWVYALSTPGELMAFDPDGVLRWRHSMMSEYGRMTFPNGRTGSPLLLDGRVIVRCITSGWGPQAPAGDRFFAFDARTGESLWVCLPGKIPKDNSFGLPLPTRHDGRQMLVAGTGCGHVVGLDPRSGEALWRYPVSIGGLNSSVVEYDGGVIAVHGRENLDSSTIGRMFSLRYPDLPPGPMEAPVEVGADHVRWRNDLAAFSSSPVLVGDRAYLTTATGDLACVEADTGEILWTEKLAPDQIHASPVAADGRLWVPMTNGTFHVVRPTDEGLERLLELQLDGSCLGAPAVARGRILVHTTEKLYCFGAPGPAPEAARAWPADPAAPAASLRIAPADFVARPGDAVPLEVRGVGAGGQDGLLPEAPVEWRVAAEFEAEVDPMGVLRVAEDSPPGVGTVRARTGEVHGSARVRVVPRLPYEEDFEGFALVPAEGGDAPAADPPAFWLGAKRKWDVRELDGSKVLAKTLDVPLFQRSLTLFGHPDQSDYTMRVDLRTGGTRRMRSTAGVIHQRYLVLLKGNHRELEVSSNVERIKETAPFEVQPDVWYTLTTRVDVEPDGSGVVRVKAWPRDEPEPDAWTLEVPHAKAHTRGAPGLFGFAPQSRFRVYVDNLSVTPDD